MQSIPGVVIDNSASSFIAFVPQAVFDKTMEGMPEETRRILKFFPAVEIRLVGIVWKKVSHEVNYELSCVNGRCIGSDALEEIFPEEFIPEDYKLEWMLHEHVTDAMGRFTMALPADQILYVGE